MRARIGGELNGFASEILLKGIKGLEKAQGEGSYDSIEGRQEEGGDVMKSKKHVLVVVRIDVEPEMEEEFNRWYNEEHIPGLLKVPGVLWAKRGINTGKGPKYIAVYEHESIDVQHSEAYRKVTQTEWTRKLEPHLLKRERDVYELL